MPRQGGIVAERSAVPNNYLAYEDNVLQIPSGPCCVLCHSLGLHGCSGGAANNEHHDGRRDAAICRSKRRGHNQPSPILHQPEPDQLGGVDEPGGGAKPLFVCGCSRTDGTPPVLPCGGSTCA